MTTENSGKRSDRPDRMRDAVRVIEDIDNLRNLHDAVPTLLFFVSAGFSVRCFFWIIDVTTWLGFDKLDPILPASTAFILVAVTLICLPIKMTSAFVYSSPMSVKKLYRSRNGYRFKNT